jgi:uncharacterized protein YhjY with autotransporter beta-barrel domain
LGIKTALAAVAYLWVNDNQPIRPAIYSIYRASRDTGSILTVLAGDEDKRHLNMRYLSPDILI